jgi:hypothetical protein
MNDKTTPVFRCSSKAGSGKSKYHVIVPWREQNHPSSHAITVRRIGSRGDAETRRRILRQVNRAGYCLVFLPKALEQLRPSPNATPPRLRASARTNSSAARGIGGDMFAQRRRGAEVEVSSRGRAHVSERERVFRTLGGVCLGVSKNCPRQHRVHRLICRCNRSLSQLENSDLVHELEQALFLSD